MPSPKVYEARRALSLVRTSSSTASTCVPDIASAIHLIVVALSGRIIHETVISCKHRYPVLLSNALQDKPSSRRSQSGAPYPSSFPRLIQTNGSPELYLVGAFSLSLSTFSLLHAKEASSHFLSLSPTSHEYRHHRQGLLRCPAAEVSMLLIERAS
jgi:hypothetical protein